MHSDAGHDPLMPRFVARAVFRSSRAEQPFRYATSLIFGLLEWMPVEDVVRLTAWARGMVQGVGFRWWVRARALELGLVGSATNLRDGRVEVVAEGCRADCERLLEQLRGPEAPGRVFGVTERWSESRGGLHGFVER